MRAITPGTASHPRIMKIADVMPSTGLSIAAAVGVLVPLQPVRHQQPDANQRTAGTRDQARKIPARDVKDDQDQAVE